MIRRILVGLGGTPFTSAAIRYAVELAQVQQANVLGMTVIDRRRLAALHKASGTAQEAIQEMRLSMRYRRNRSRPLPTSNSLVRMRACNMMSHRRAAIRSRQ